MSTFQATPVVDLFAVTFVLRAEKTWMFPTTLPAAIRGTFTQEEWWCVITPINQVLNNARKDFEERTPFWLACFRPGLSEDSIVGIQKSVDRLLAREMPLHVRISSVFDAVPMFCNQGAHRGLTIICDLTFEFVPAAFPYHSVSRAGLLHHTSCDAAALLNVRCPGSAELILSEYTHDEKPGQSTDSRRPSEQSAVAFSRETTASEGLNAELRPESKQIAPSKSPHRD